MKAGGTIGGLTGGGGPTIPGSGIAGGVTAGAYTFASKQYAKQKSLLRRTGNYPGNVPLDVNPNNLSDKELIQRELSLEAMDKISRAAMEVPPGTFVNFADYNSLVANSQRVTAALQQTKNSILERFFTPNPPVSNYINLSGFKDLFAPAAGKNRVFKTKK